MATLGAYETTEGRGGEGGKGKGKRDSPTLSFQGGTGKGGSRGRSSCTNLIGRPAVSPHSGQEEPQGGNPFSVGRAHPSLQ